MTLTTRILRLARRSPGLTAWRMAKALNPTEPKYVTGSVSSTLNRLAKEGRLARARNAAGTWVYRRP